VSDGAQPPGKGTPHRAGFVAIAGRPNVGKSTLLNRLLGQKVAIVSPKPQTTRGRILGVVTRPGAQFCLLDTPGLHDAKGGLNARMVQSALQTLSDAEVALFLIEAGSPAIDSATRKALDQVKAAHKPLLLVINKIDTVEKTMLLPLIDRWRKEHDWTEIYPLSALKGDNVDGLLDALVKHLPEGPEIFGPEVFTDASERDLCAELIREQILRKTEQEVPYSAAVLIEEFDEEERETGRHGLVRITATVLVERDSQKGILIGKKGAMLKEIGSDARREMERLLGCKVFLQLHVRVEPEWTRSDKGLSRAGYGQKS
jgi:GTPase